MQSTSATDSGWGSLEARIRNKQQETTDVQSVSVERDEAKSSMDTDKSTSAADSGLGSLKAMSLKERQDTVKAAECTNPDNGKGISTAVRRKGKC